MHVCYVCVCVYVCMCMYACVCMYVCMYVCMCMYACMHVYVCMHAYMYVCVQYQLHIRKILVHSHTNPTLSSIAMVALLPDVSWWARLFPIYVSAVYVGFSQINVAMHFGEDVVRI